jgi:hypothetical protein
VSPLVKEMEGNPARWLRGLNAKPHKVICGVRSVEGTAVSPLCRRSKETLDAGLGVNVGKL